MSGTGESWPLMLKKKNVQIKAVDISAEMLRKAKQNLLKHPSWKVELCEENVLQSSIPSNSCDFVVSTFGLKTFSLKKQKTLAKEVARILKKGGQLAFIEISRPKNALLRIPFMFYLRFVIPLVGKLFMGNSDDYRMLGIYCHSFEDCSHFASFLQAEGLQVEMKNYFLGCATGVVGFKNQQNPRTP